MKTAYVFSDLHVDFLIRDEKETHTYEEVLPLLQEWYAKWCEPHTDYLIAAGDFSNDFETFTYFCKFISDKYEKVFMVPGNHDLTVRGATPNTSNLQFETSFQKIEAMKAECKKYGNLFMLDGDVVGPIGGTMGMCDFEYRPHLTVNYVGYWKNHWYDGKHWRLGDVKPYELLAQEKAKLNYIIDKKPKVVMTHFSPVEIGVPFEYRWDLCTCFFVFNGEEFLEKMPNDSYWICGHTHNFAQVDYKCKNGNVVHLLRNPCGYPGDEWDNWKSQGLAYQKENFIIQLPE